jgi:hypothetical protein
MIQIGTDSAGKLEVVLENNRLRCRYGWAMPDQTPESYITDLMSKHATGPQSHCLADAGAASRIDAAAGRGELTDAVVVYRNIHEATARLTWRSLEGPSAIQEVTIYEDRPYLKIHHRAWAVNIVDIATPGGIRQGQYTVHGAEQWKREFTFYPEIYFDRYSGDIGYQNITEIDEPGSLSFHGWFIMGIANPVNGTGYGRVAPVENIDIVKLLFKEPALGQRGFELFPCYQREHTPFISYLFVFAEDAIELGKRIVERRIGEIE